MSHDIRRLPTVSTGKTQYALWLARRLGRDVVLKRPSDLLSKWVGDSEKLIAAAFREAERTGSVLVIDEADALLYDRGTAVRSWEHSQIAEFLQQIQEFEGILIACTNRVEGVDPALRRRFHKHLNFGPIATRATLEAALAHVFPNAAFSPDDLDAFGRGPKLMMSDLATAAQMIAIDTDAPSSRDIVREILANAQEALSQIETVAAESLLSSGPTSATSARKPPGRRRESHRGG